MKCIVVLLLIAQSILATESYRILGIFPYNGKSHDVMLTALMKGLAIRGHQVDLVTNFPLKNPPKNYNVLVNLYGTKEQNVNNFTIDFARSLRDGAATNIVAKKYGNGLCDLLKVDGIQRLIKNPPNDPPYDLMIGQTFGAHCFFGIAHLFGIPLVTVSTSMEFPWVSHSIGNADNLAVNPIIYSLDFDRQNFWHRLQNVFFYYWNILLFHALTEDYQTDMMRRYIDPNLPSVRELERSVALTLVNRHPLIYGAKPVTASLIEVSGLHIEESPPKLSSEMQKWLDEGTAGVVYFTFGSMVLIETLPRDTIFGIYRSFEKLAHMRVIMKVANKTKLPPGLPANVMISSWIPQQAVLNHKNVRVFLTHGGLMGCQEALHFGVPMVGVPLFADQSRNIKTFVDKKMAISIDFENLTTAALDDAFDKIFNDPTYSENARRYSKLFKDKPLSAMETASFWVEYVIRNGPNTLRSPALDLYWWQLLLLDVFGFVLLCIIFAVILIYCVIRLLWKLCSTKLQKKVKTQ